MQLFGALLGVYILGILGVSWWAGQKESPEDYLIAGQNRGWFQIGMSKYAASVGAGWFIAYTGFSYEYGSPLALVFIGGLLGVLFYAFWAVPRIRTLRTTTAYS